ncbi:MAG: hypothetical protein R2939_14440 [Kofleriaceae bacterium]
MTYAPGDVVTHGDAPDLYICTATSTGEAPPDAPGRWAILPRGADDVRVADGSPYAGLGVQ